jgi:Holliday junction resolvase-like predicted endonuclease
VAKRQDSIHFVEVKYRVTDLSGSGIEYITPKKLKQMQLASQHWVYENNWEGDYQLDVVAIDGEITLGNISFVQNVS